MRRCLTKGDINMGYTVAHWLRQFPQFHELK